MIVEHQVDLESGVLKRVRPVSRCPPMKSDEWRLVDQTDSTIDQSPHVVEFLVVATKSGEVVFR